MGVALSRKGLGTTCIHVHLLIEREGMTDDVMSELRHHFVFNSFRHIRFTGGYFSRRLKSGRVGILLSKVFDDFVSRHVLYQPVCGCYLGMPSSWHR